MMAVGQVGRDLDPLPALGGDCFRLAPERLGHQPLEQRRVLQPAAVVALEQVAHDRAARRLVDPDADEQRPLVGRAHRALGQHAPDDVGVLDVGLAEPLVGLLLPGMVAVERERHQLVQRQPVLGVGVQQLGRHRRQPQPLLDHGDGDEERGGDLLLGLAALAQRQEGPELVERVQGRALHVLGQAVLLGDAVGADHARDRRRLGQALLPHQQLQRPVAPSAGRDLIHPGLGAVRVQHGPHGEGLQQGAPGDVVGELLDRDARLDPAHIAGAQQQLVEGNVARGAEGDLLDG